MESRQESSVQAPVAVAAGAGTSSAGAVVPFRRPRSGVVLSIEVPEGHCPKCVAPRPADAQSCRACGLVFAHASPGLFAFPPELVSGWEELAPSWEDLAAHERFLAAASDRGQLAEAAKLYRIRLVQAPSDPMAARAREEALRLVAIPVAAAAQSRPRPSTEKPPMDLRRALTYSGVVLLLCWGAWILWSLLE
jgi:hypothetical protein